MEFFECIIGFFKSLFEPKIKTEFFRSWTISNMNAVQGSVTVSGNGFVSISHKGEILLYFYPDKIQTIRSGKYDLSGDIEGGLKFSSSTATLIQQIVDNKVGFRLEFAPLSVTIEDPLLTLIRNTRIEVYLKNSDFIRKHKRSMAFFDFTLESLIPLGDLHYVKKGKLNGKLTIEDNSAGKSQPQGDEEISILCKLLSVAQRCAIYPCYREEYVDSSIKCIYFFENNEKCQPNRTLIESDAIELCEFLEQTYPNYVAQNLNFKVWLLIEYYWRSHQVSIDIHKFLFGSVFMEALKFSYGENLSSYYQDKNSSGIIKGFKVAASDVKHVHFKKLLYDCANHLSYPLIPPTCPGHNSGPFTFIDERNAIFHSGLSTASQLGITSSWVHIKPELEKLYEQMDDYLLRILNYKGNIYNVDFSNPDKIVEFPSRRII